MNLINYGWNDFFNSEFEKYSKQGLYPARISAQSKDTYKLFTEIGEITGKVSGKFQYNSIGKGDYPTVGDWVAISLRPEENSCTIHSILPRRSNFSRKNAGIVTEEQVLAANFDYIFIITSLNHNFNIRRIERYLTIAWDSGGIPIVILSKSDLCDNVPEYVKKVENIALGVPVHTISSLTGDGIDEIKQYLKEGVTATILGSSGVGKSSLLNRLADEELMDVSSIREDDSRGRHTTTHRQLVLLQNGGLIIDTPGIREIALWDVEDGINNVFDDIADIASQCKFTNCTHENEPGCKVRDAINNGTIDMGRYKSYIKLLKEMKHIEKKQSHLIKKQQTKNKKTFY